VRASITRCQGVVKLGRLYTMPVMVDPVYLSPHLDDVVLSCGGRIALRARAGERVQVVTAFAGDPLGGLSPFASSLHRRWELGYEAPTARRAEDRTALSLVGATPVHWDLPECIYRHAPDGTSLYPDEASLWGSLHLADRPLVESLVRRIAALSATAFLCVPLAAGGHVDHRLVRQAAEAAGRPLLYYEDYPYADDPHEVEAALGGDGWEPQVAFLDEEALAVKIAAVACYRSQLNTFWASEEEMVGHIRAYALHVGEGRLAERCWRRAQQG
jgi:LmbE family N-acetylglucosaminyl deacetylase